MTLPCGLGHAAALSLSLSLVVRLCTQLSAQVQKARRAASMRWIYVCVSCVSFCSPAVVVVMLEETELERRGREGIFLQIRS